MTKIYVTSMRRTERTAALLVAGLIGGGGLALGVAELSGAVVAPAVVVVENNTRKIQHLDGGLVAQILVRNGDMVAAGDVLLRLDPTEAVVSLEIAQSQLDEMRARKARLVCESTGCTELPRVSVTGRETTASANAALAGQGKLLDARRDARQSKKKQIVQRIEQLHSAHQAITAQIASNRRQATLSEREYTAVLAMESKGLVPMTRSLTVQRERERIDGETHRLTAEQSRVAAQVSETEIQLIEVDQTNLAEILTDLRDAEAKESELGEKVTALRARRDRAVVVAPESGLVHNLTPTTIAGVIKAGETLAEIVPQSDELILEARVDAGQIDRLAVGQSTHVRFPNLNQRVTPVLAGSVVMVSADANQDQRSGQGFFVVQTKLKAGELARLNGQRLRPGMPAEVQFATGDRTLWSWLMKPVADQMSRAMLEP